MSHEALELVIDPLADIIVPGPDPRGYNNNMVLNAYEAVERTNHEIDGVRVSNFISPSYFTAVNEKGTRNDFLGVGVMSFSAIHRSHISFLDLLQGKWEIYYGSGMQLNIVQNRWINFLRKKKTKRPKDEEL